MVLALVVALMVVLEVVDIVAVVAAAVVLRIVVVGAAVGRMVAPPLHRPEPYTSVAFIVKAPRVWLEVGALRRCFFSFTMNTVMTVTSS
ncbi:hypothetical protein AK812_SmicGene29983 [Symbiodinium microadriaticum]|uniref:Uncharacterized protein n=1 Tax=Symbiodinium microadriaticum TaxID=2951 RepID=A0A1Q9D0G1_SYMMI|nr:hypothetical protein AK812_SmicGene29983 [Symbiodinium microadriaticum]